MNVPSGLDLGIIVSVVTLAITALGAFFYWKGRLDEWKEGMNDWKEAVNTTLDTLKKDIRVIMVDIGTIRTNLEKDVSKDGMMQRQSPVVLSDKAIETLENLSIISQVEANLPLITELVEERFKSSLYRDIRNPEERFIEIAPSVIHQLVEKRKIDESKIDEAMEKLGEIFSPNVATYYGVLLLIASYVLKQLKKEGFIRENGKSIFLSYSMLDKEFVDQLAGDLIKNGIDVWLDTLEIKAGGLISEEISKGIKDYDFFGIVLSRNSVRSKWAQTELDAALMKETKEKRLAILPILIDNCEIPAIIQDRKFADFRLNYDQGLRELLNVLLFVED